MALVDLTKILCNSAGTGPFVLGANVPGYFGVEQLTDGATYGYSVQRADGTKEYGRGTYSGGALSRNVIQSSAGTDPIAVMVGDKIAFAALAEDIATAGVGPNLTAISNQNTSADKLTYWTGSGTAGLTTLTSFGRSLIAAVDQPGARSALGLGTIATASASAYPLLSGGAAFGGAVTGTNLSGTNTGDQTNITGNAATATKLQTARTINGVAFDGTSDITLAAGGIGTLIADRGYLPFSLALGAAPNNALYEMNAGGQGSLTPAYIQVAMVGQPTGSSLIEAFQFADDSKAVILQYMKSRGNGIVGDAGMHKKTLSGDRLFLMGIYGSADSDGFNTPTGGHAGYLGWTQEYDTPSPCNGEVDAMFFLHPGTTKKSGADAHIGVGGIQGNCLGQVYFSGANQAQHNARDRYRALVEIGASVGTAEKYQALGFNSASLIDPGTDPDKIFDGGVEYFNGNLYFTHSSDGAGAINRRKILTAAPMTLGAVPTSPNWTATTAMGPDWATLTVIVGGADITAAGIGFAGRINFGTPLPVAPIIFGSRDADASIPDDAIFGFNSTAARITCILKSGTMKANATYIFSVIIRQP